MKNLHKQKLQYSHGKSQTKAKRKRKRKSSATSSDSPTPIYPLRKLQHANPAKNNLNASFSQDLLEYPSSVSASSYGYLYFDTFAAAIAAANEIEKQAKTVDQFHIVIKEEGDMSNIHLTSIAENCVVLAGAAWSLVHNRRKASGWYEDPLRKVQENSLCTSKKS